MQSIDAQALAAWLRKQATQEGFHLFGVAPAVSPPGYPRLLAWIDAGYAAEMDYIAARAPAYQHPLHVFPNVQSIVVLGFPYRTTDHASPQVGRGRVARYAWGTADYHDLVHARFKRIQAALKHQYADVRSRGVVDSAPLMEREFARLAGIGWSGKNSLTLNKHQGSYFFLACLLLDCKLPSNQPHAMDHCGTCTRCLDACPTDAFVAPGVLDSRRCISYLTIEHRGAIPSEFRPLIGDWIFGCDVCQDVCPWNRRGSQATDAALLPRQTTGLLELTELFSLSDDQFRQRFRKTPLWRSRRRGLLRNAAIVLGNQKASQAASVLRQALGDCDPLVRGSCAWALGQINVSETETWLRAAASLESDPEVQREIQNALAQVVSSGPSQPPQ